MTFTVSNYFQQDFEILINEIRSFIVQLHKFFFDSDEMCDWELAKKELNYMNSQVGALLNRIKTRQEQVSMIRGGTTRSTRITINEEDESWLENPLSASSESSLETKSALDEIHERLTNLEGVIGIEVDKNMFGGLVTGNLKRAKNFSNLAGLLDLS